MRRLATSAAVLLLATACAGAGGPFRCPAHGGPTWRELASDHFVLRTDLPAREAGALVGRLERMRAAVAAALYAEAQPPPGRVEVIAFRSVAEYAPFAPAGANGYYFRYAGGPPRIVLSGGLGTSELSLLAHELTHHFLSGAFARQPRWFAEGMAVYMESLGEDEPAPGHPIILGAPPGPRLERLYGLKLPVRELLAWDGTIGLRRTALDWYAASWLLVHWLAHRRPEEFADLQRRLAAGEDPDAAWRGALPDLDPARGAALEALDGLLAAYVRSGLERTRRAVEVPVAVGYFEQAVPPAEVHAIRLALWQHGPPKGAAALRAELEETLAEDPAHPIALQLQAALERRDPLPAARTAAATHPDDPRAWTFLAGALQGKAAAAEREHAFRRAVELAPGNPAALHNLAAELLAQGRSGEALPVARRAAHLAPWAPPILAGYAAVLSDLGRCAEALPVQLRAVDALPERAAAEARVELLGGLAAYAAQCKVTAGTEPDGAGP